MENYLICVQNPQYRNALTIFRTSSHTLEIERGRHTNPITPIEQRLCNVCLVLEDKFHFLLECNMFTDERTAFLHQIQNKYSQFIALDNKENLFSCYKMKILKLYHRPLNSFIMPRKKRIIWFISNYDQQLFVITRLSWCARLDNIYI